MDPEHRKIELQSPADLHFLQSRIRAAARQKLDLHLPPVSSASSDQPDDLRRKTEDLVDIFVAQILDGMRKNVSINGMPVVVSAADSSEASVLGGDGDGGPSEVETEEFEDLDGKLRERLRAMVARRDGLIGKIAQHRRRTPGLAARRFREEFEGEMAGAEEARREAERLGASIEGREGEVVGVEGLTRKEEVERTWERAVEGLVRLNAGLPETRARLERAGEVVGYLEGTGGRGVKGEV